MAETSSNETRPGSNTCPKVSFASLLRWGTEPEGWCVDLPYADLTRRELLPFGMLSASNHPTLCQSPDYGFSNYSMIHGHSSICIG
jgi:hypothetical protein